MKKILVTLISAFLICSPAWCDSFGRLHNYLTIKAFDQGGGTSASSTSFTRIDAPAEEIAYRFVADNTSEITDVQVNLAEGGDISGIEWELEIQTDTSAHPSGSVLGVKTAPFTVVASGWTGDKALGTATGALTIGAAYWLVLDVASGTPSGTNYGSVGYATRNDQADRGDLYTGSWATVRDFTGNILMKHADGSYSGMVRETNVSSSGKQDIYNDGTDYRQGLKFILGTTATIQGVEADVVKVGSPGTITCKLYEGSTLKATSGVRNADTIGGAGNVIFKFTTPYQVDDTSTYYITFENSAGNGSNDYDIRCAGDINSTYPDTHQPQNWDFIYGNGVDPTAYTVANDKGAPLVGLLFVDPAAELDDPAGGGGCTNAFGVIQ